MEPLIVTLDMDDAIAREAVRASIDLLWQAETKTRIQRLELEALLWPYRSLGEQ